MGATIQNTVEETALWKLQNHEDRILASYKAKTDEEPSRILNVRGVMEVWPDQSFEAALESNDGNHVVAGGSWRSGMERAEEAIKSAYSNLRAPQAVHQIARIWEEIDRVSELAEARTQLLLKRIPKPELADLPTWFNDAVQECRDSEYENANPFPFNADALVTATMLVRAVLGKFGDVRAKISVGPKGRVILDWLLTDHRFQWMVEAPDSPWPCIKVYQMAIEVTSGKSQSRILHNVADAIAELEKRN